MSAVSDAERGLAWAGADIEQIRARWTDGGPAEPVLALCGEHRIPASVPHHDVLEALRAARSDTQYLLSLIDRLAAGPTPGRTRPCQHAPKETR